MTDANVYDAAGASKLIHFLTFLPACCTYSPSFSWSSHLGSFVLKRGQPGPITKASRAADPKIVKMVNSNL